METENPNLKKYEAAQKRLEQNPEVTPYAACKSVGASYTGFKYWKRSKGLDGVDSKVPVSITVRQLLRGYSRLAKTVTLVLSFEEVIQTMTPEQILCFISGMSAERSPGR